MEEMWRVMLISESLGVSHSSASLMPELEAKGDLKIKTNKPET
jgi:hypothetical protein